MALLPTPAEHGPPGTTTIAVPVTSEGLALFRLLEHEGATERDFEPKLSRSQAKPLARTPAGVGFEERVRVGEAHRAQLRVGADGAVIVADVRGDQVAPGAGIVSQIVKVRVPDVDAAFARARDLGMRVVQEPTTYEYGERSRMLEDVGGHRWELTQTVRDVAPEEWGGVTVAPW